MPVFGPEAFDDHAVAGIASYVAYLQQPRDPGGQPLWHLGPLAEGIVAFFAAIIIGGALILIGERRLTPAADGGCVTTSGWSLHCW